MPLRSYPASSANIMEAAPTFKAKAVVDGDIVDVTTDDYKGKWLVLLFYPKVSSPGFAQATLLLGMPCISCMRNGEGAAVGLESRSVKCMWHQRRRVDYQQESLRAAQAGEWGRSSGSLYWKG